MFFIGFIKVHADFKAKEEYDHRNEYVFTQNYLDYVFLDEYITKHREAVKNFCSQHSSISEYQRQLDKYFTPVEQIKGLLIQDIPQNQLKNLLSCTDNQELENLNQIYLQINQEAFTANTTFTKNDFCYLLNENAAELIQEKMDVLKNFKPHLFELLVTDKSIY